MRPISHATCRLAAALGLALASPFVGAVTVNPHGTGQVLLYPFYTVDGQRTTLLSITNESERGKVLRLYFRESRNGRDVLAFNLYLSPHDVWTGTVFTTSDTDAADLLTDDSSCTSPAIATNQTLPALPDGRHYIPFRNFGYASPNQDAGSPNLTRTREGTIEVIELGSIAPDSVAAKAIAPQDNGMPKDCNVVLGAQADTAEALNAFGIRNPTGGLHGTAALVNISEGRMFGYDATALEDFRVDPTDLPRGTKLSVAQVTAASTERPDLRDAVTDPAKAIASADVYVDGRSVHVEYPTSRAIDAVTATLMASTLSNDVLMTPAEVDTYWVSTLPTRRYYTDQALVGNAAIAPFTQLYPTSGDPQSSCSPVYAQAFERNGVVRDQVTIKVLCGASQEIGNMLSVDFDGVPPESQLMGWARWELRDTSQAGPYLMRPANDGTQFAGLPVIGFAEINFDAKNFAGTAANYSSHSAHRTVARCSGGPADQCK